MAHRVRAPVLDPTCERLGVKFPLSTRLCDLRFKDGNESLRLGKIKTKPKNLGTKGKVQLETQLHFVTFAVVEWVDALTRSMYKEVLIDSLRYCQKHQGLVLYAWCIMTNHVHLVISSLDGIKQEDILRDFKKYTSKQ